MKIAFFMIGKNTLNQTNGAIYSMGFGLDATNAFTQTNTYTQVSFAGVNEWNSISTSIITYPGIGYHFLSLNEQSTAGVATTLNNSVALLSGQMRC